MSKPTLEPYLGLEESIGRVADVIRDMFHSPNVSDSNLESANLVDTTDDISRALWRLGDIMLVCAVIKNRPAACSTMEEAYDQLELFWEIRKKRRGY